MTAQVTIVGNATRPPEMRFTPSGSAVATFGVAENRRWQDGRGEWQEATSFFDVVCWRQLAENVAESIEKGTAVIIVGRLDQRTWETEQGEKRSKVEVVADAVGPSLRWATCLVERNERRGDHDPGPTDPNAVRTPPDPHQAGPAVPASADGYRNDEEPY